MSVAVTEIARTVFGNKRAVLASIAFDSSYPTGGEPLSAQTLGLQTIDAVLVEGLSAGRGVAYDKTNSKLLVYGIGSVGTHTHTGAAHTHTAGAITDAGHTHVENAAASYTQSAVTGSGTAAATGAASGSTTPGAGGAGGSVSASPAAEVADTTDLSAFSVIILVLGV